MGSVATLSFCFLEPFGANLTRSWCHRTVLHFHIVHRPLSLAASVPFHSIAIQLVCFSFFSVLLCAKDTFSFFETATTAPLP